MGRAWHADLPSCSSTYPAGKQGFRPLALSFPWLLFPCGLCATSASMFFRTKGVRRVFRDCSTKLTTRIDFSQYITVTTLWPTPSICSILCSCLMEYARTANISSTRMTACAFVGRSSWQTALCLMCLMRGLRCERKRAPGGDVRVAVFQRASMKLSKLSAAASRANDSDKPSEC
ncbi:hypothetical protein BJV77DRAFT_121403 [Russula vinacea]|nr:hypothetical protein BJV77DRAFT_121403 [Russula vinacea]